MNLKGNFNDLKLYIVVGSNFKRFVHHCFELPVIRFIESDFSH